ncbi:MAG: putative bicarbonate transporter, IctB family [Chloroflexaceae bacterium]|nr:putative bicarbonate transporter, IctB family [Chloroflexaceae bacterium]
MNTVWRRLTLLNWHPARWRGGSYLYHLVGLLGPWRAESWLLRYGDWLGTLLVALVLLLGPFVPTGIVGLVLVGGAGYWLLLTLTETEGPSVTPIHLLVCLYWAVALLAVAFSPVKSAALSGWMELTLYLLQFALAARVLRSPSRTNILVVLLLLVSLVVGVYGVRQQFFGAEQLATWNDPTSTLAGNTRVYSYLGNPNLLAGYLLLPLGFSIAALFAWRRWLPKTLALLAIVINGACLYFTDSRGGWIGMLVLLVAWLLLLRVWWRERLPRFWRRWLLPLVLGGAAVVLLGAIAALEPLRLRVMSIFAGREDSSNNFRLNVWLAVIEMIRDRPLLGIGPGNDAFEAVYPLYMQPRFTALSAYSIYLEIAAELGFLGLGLFVWLLAVTLGGGLQALERLRQRGDAQGFWLMGALAALAGLLAHGLVDTVWYRPQIQTLWWFCVALIASRYPLLAPHPDSET